MAINAIGAGSGGPGLLEEARSSGGEHFAKTVAQALHDVNNDQIAAAEKIKALVVDGEGSIHDAMLAVSKAEGSVRLLMEMRNRLVDGINRLLQTQV